MIESPLGWIDPACPVNWNHPLNRGLVGLRGGLPIPGWSGGATMRDFVRGGRKPNDGALINGPTWASGRNGRSVSFSGGSSQYVQLPATAFDGLGSGATAILAVRWTSNSQDGGFGGTAGGVLARQLNGSHSQMVLCLNGSSADTAKIAFGTYTFTISAWGSSPGLNRWRHVAVTWVSGAQAGYLDGIQDWSASSTGTWQSPSASWINTIGAWAGDGGAYSDSQVQSCWIYDRILSPAQIAAHYSQWRQGFPDLLNWVDEIPVVVPVTAPPTSSIVPIAMNHRRMMGAA